MSDMTEAERHDDSSWFPPAVKVERTAPLTCPCCHGKRVKQFAGRHFDPRECEDCHCVWVEEQRKLDPRIAELTAWNNTLRSDMAGLTAQVQALEAENAELAGQVTDLGAEVARLQEVCRLAGVGDHRADFTQGKLTETGQLRAEVARLRPVLIDIARMVDPDDPNSYRNDDPHGCLNAIEDKLAVALTAAILEARR